MTASSALAAVPAAWRPFEDHRFGARRAGSLPVREDLRLIRFAERLGYEVGFRDGNCHHGTTFTLGATTVWWACRTGSSMVVWWQAKTVFVEEDGVERYEREARVYGSGLAGLKAALKAEWRRARSPGGARSHYETRLIETGTGRFDSARLDAEIARHFGHDVIELADGTFQVRWADWHAQAGRRRPCPPLSSSADAVTALMRDQLPGWTAQDVVRGRISVSAPPERTFAPHDGSPPRVEGSYPADTGISRARGLLLAIEDAFWKGAVDRLYTLAESVSLLSSDPSKRTQKPKVSFDRETGTFVRERTRKGCCGKPMILEINGFPVRDVVRRPERLEGSQASPG